MTFTYPGKEEDVLKGVSFTIRPGETCALVGPSGSGKSTIVDLLFKFYDAGKGSIKVDGRDVTEWDTDWLRSQMAIVTQDVMMRSGSLADFQVSEYRFDLHALLLRSFPSIISSLPVCENAYFLWGVASLIWKRSSVRSLICFEISYPY